MSLTEQQNRWGSWFVKHKKPCGGQFRSISPYQPTEFQQKDLRAARVLVHGRYVTLVIAPAAARLWQALWKKLSRLKLAPAPA